MAESNMTKRTPVKAAPPRNATHTPPAAKSSVANASAAKLPAGPTSARRDAPKGLEASIERLETSVADLKRERDSLAAELAAAKAEIATLDAARRTAIDRIDWVIDSLNTVLQDNS